MSYLRPQSIPNGRVPYLVCLPDTPEWRTQFWGAIADLTDSWRWEGDSSLSDDEIGSVWTVVLNSFRRASILTAGLINLWPGETLPDGWLQCNGDTLNTADYPELFAVIGYTFGGSGSTFQLPDLTDRFPVGAGDTYDVGQNGGSNTVTLTSAQLPSHTHTTHTHGAALAVAPGELPVTVPAIGTELTGSVGNGNSHENRPPYLALNFIICTGELC